MDTLLRFVHSTEQAKETMAEKQSLWERSKCKVAEKIKAAKDEAQKTLDATRLEHQLQLDEVEQILANCATKSPIWSSNWPTTRRGATH